MGFGRSEAIFKEGRATIRFETGGLTSSFTDRAADRAIDLAYGKWFESFAIDCTNLTRDEFSSIHDFIYRDMSPQELAALRAQGKTGKDEHVRRWKEEQAKKEQMQRDLDDEARRI